MSLCQRTVLLSVVLVSCAFQLLPTTLGAIHSPEAREKEDNSELIGLLKKLRARLDNVKAADETLYRSVHDNVNEERTLGDARGTGLQTDGGKAVRLSLRSDTTLTQDQQTQLVDEMNSRRRSEGASDMYKLHWNTKLAKLGKYWAEQCEFKHGYLPYNYDEVGFSTVGQNLYAYEGSFDAARIVGDWYDDKENFDPDSQKCEHGKACGSYKQLVTGYTTDVGCGLSTCKIGSISTDANFIVCYFGPPGNYRDVATFAVGSPCTSCKHGQFYCNDGLCDHTCTATGPDCACQARCKQCGTVTSDCRCQCQAGSAGVNCGKTCEDHDSKCGKRNGWPKSYCSDAFPFVLEACPKLCHLCEPGTPCNADDVEPDKPEKPSAPDEQPDDGEYHYFD
jgi:pathogenesis-related protein 1